MPWGYIQFEIVKKCKISHPSQDQVSGERYRTVGPLIQDHVSIPLADEFSKCKYISIWPIIYQVSLRYWLRKLLPGDDNKTKSFNGVQ